MIHDLEDIALELRRHLAWQESDGTRTLLRDPAAPPVLAPAQKAAPPRSERAASPEVTVQPERRGSDGLRREPTPAPAPGPVRTLDEIRTELGDCQRCKLAGGRTNLVFGVGNPKAELVFVGEAPGQEEDLQGVPFVGKAGQLLTKMIEAMKFTRDDVYICNVVKCRPPNNRNPEPEEIAKCEPFLKAQLASLRPKVIVTLGKFAAQTLLRDQTAITRLRGQWRTYEGVALMPTFHPAYLLRVPAEKRVVWMDLQEVMKKLGRT